MRYVLLLRGINVGGKNKVSMSDLEQLLLNAGFEDVASYINSGNVFFSSTQNRESFIPKITYLLNRLRLFYSFCFNLKRRVFRRKSRIAGVVE